MNDTIRARLQRCIRNLKKCEDCISETRNDLEKLLDPKLCDLLLWKAANEAISELESITLDAIIKPLETELRRLP